MVGEVAVLALASLSSIPVEPGVHTPAQIQKIAEAVKLSQQTGNRTEILFKKGWHEMQASLVIGGENVSVKGEKGSVVAGGPQSLQWNPVRDDSILSRLPAQARSQVKQFVFPASGAGPAQFTVRGFGMSSGASHTELFADGIPLRPARYPNKEGEIDKWMLTGEIQGKTGFGFDDPFLKGLKSVDDVWVYGYWQYDWADSWQKIKSLDTAKGMVELEPSNGPLESFGLHKSRRWFVANVLEALDQPGEYWIDYPRKRVVAWLPNAAKEVSMSMLGDPLIKVAGARNVVVKDLTLACTRAAAIDISDSTNVECRSINIRNSGADGVNIRGGSRCGVRDSEITQTAGGGVTLTGGDRKTLSPGGHYVEDSSIHHIGRWCRTYKPAVYVEGVANRVVGCDIFETPHTAILFNGNDHLFERCDFRRICLDTSDAGAVYCGRDTTTRGTVIKWNRFRQVEPRTFTEGNFGDLVMSVYLDDCQAGISVIGNIFESKGTGIMIGGGRDNKVEGNIFLNNGVGVRFDMRARGWAKEYFQNGWEFKERIKAMPILESPWKERYPKLYEDIKNGADLSYAEGNTMINNVSAGGEWIAYLDGLTQKDLEYAGNHRQSEPLALKDALQILRNFGRPIPIERIGRPKRSGSG